MLIKTIHLGITLFSGIIAAGSFDRISPQQQMDYEVTENDNYSQNFLPQNPPSSPPSNPPQRQQQRPFDLTQRPQPQQLQQQLQKLKRTSLNPAQHPQQQNLKRHVHIHRQQPAPQQRNLQKITPSPQQNAHRNAESIKVIGPHNLPDHYFDLRWMAKSTHKSLLDAIKDTYKIRPIVRDLDLSHMDDKEIFTIVKKREIAWSHADMNQFGLMRCEDLQFRNSPFAGYIELVPDGRRISIQKFDDSVAYQKVSKASKDLQTRCLIKALEKTPSPTPIAGDCKSQIPFCFSDSWRQIWWKVTE